jgi:hypothetical protein
MNAKTVAPLILIGLPLVGCGDGNDHEFMHEPDPTCTDCIYPPYVEPLLSTIDANAELSPPLAGEEAGLFIEHLQDPGSAEWYWRVTASCDTHVSGSACSWDVLATPTTVPSYEDSVPTGDDPRDTLGLYDPYTVAMYSITDFELDGFLLYTDPGVTVEFEIYLDRDAVQGQRYVYWIGDGAVHAGAPSNVIDLTPVGY